MWKWPLPSGLRTLVGVVVLAGGACDHAPEDDPGAGDAASGSGGDQRAGGGAGTANHGGASATGGGTSDGGFAARGGSGGGSSEEGGGPPQVVAGPKLELMSFNIRVGTANDGANSWDQRKQLVYDVLHDHDADIVGLQEDLKFQLLAIDDQLPGHGRIGVGAKDGAQAGEYCSIYWKKARLKLVEGGEFWLSSTPNQPGSTSFGNDLPRVVTWGLFEVKTTGYQFYVYNGHFDHISQSSREEGAELVTKRIENRPVAVPFVFMGDLNVAEDNRVTRFLKGKIELDGEANPVAMADTFRLLHPDTNQARTAHGFNGSTTGQKIDYIYVRKNVGEVLESTIDHYNVNGRYPSDHFPITATIRMPDQ